MTHLINRNNVNRHRATKNHLSVNIRINENNNGKITDLQVQTCRNCPDEFCQDSRQYIGDLLNWKDRLTKTRKTGNTMAADVKALYPSLCRDTVTKVLECALEKHSKFNKAPEIIVQLNKICLNNVVTQYGDQLYTKKNGVVTGDKHSVSLANIAVHYISYSRLLGCYVKQNFSADLSMTSFG